MKIFLIGDWHSELHEEIIKKSFIKFGHKVSCFKWFKYFETKNNKSYIFKFLRKIQNKYLLGPILKTINIDFLDACRKQIPDVVFIYRGSHIFPETLKSLKEILPNVSLIGYNNDDPFSLKYPKWMWRHFLNGLKYYDITFAYRKKNLKEFENAGAKNVYLLRSWFDPERNYPKNIKKSSMLHLLDTMKMMGE